MAATGFTPLSLYYSTTASSTPSTGNLTSGELAINITDGKLFYKDNAGAIQVIATKNVASGIFVGTGAITVPVGTAANRPTGVQGMFRYNTTTPGFEGFDGSVWGAIGGGSGPGAGVSSFSAGSTGLTPSTASTGAIVLGGTLGISSGGTNSTAVPTAGGVGYGTGSAHAYSSAGTSGQPLISAGASGPAFGTLALGTANTNVSGTLTPTNGGTGVSTLTGIAFGNGSSAFTTASSSQILSAISNVPVANGGTGQSTLTTNYVMVGNGTSAIQLISPTANAGYVLTSNGTGTAPTFQPATGGGGGGVSSFSAGSTGLTPNTASTGAVTLSGTLNIASGGTNGTATPVLGGVIVGTGTAYSSTAAGAVGYVLTSNGSGAAPTWQTILQTPGTTVTGSAGSILPTITTAQYNATAISSNVTIAAPATGVDGQRLLLRFKDNGVPRTLNWTVSAGGYRGLGVALPTPTVANTPLYIGCVYNAQDNYWDVLAVSG